ncbi:hypothetical protein [Halobacillus sp. B23F22_1]|uniref:hypothetical protein n=1 Tax=Halobacillus sp. B23F22_1 TaxID=3459514 RepID=UPI00373F6A6D
MMIPGEHTKLKTQKITPYREGTTEVEVKGISDMPVYHHDLKVKAIISLLETINTQEYIYANKTNQAEEHYSQIINATKYSFNKCNNRKIRR